MVLSQKENLIINNETIKKALEICSHNDENQCWHCPYIHHPEGCLALPADALKLVLQYEKQIEELEDELSAIEANDY